MQPSTVAVSCNLAVVSYMYILWSTFYFICFIINWIYISTFAFIFVNKVLWPAQVSGQF
jgi:hypothetical protein